MTKALLIHTTCFEYFNLVVNLDMQNKSSKNR